MKSLYLFGVLAACGVGAVALPAQAEELDTNGWFPRDVFIPVKSVVLENPEAYVQVLSPNGGDVLRPGQTVTVMWNASGHGTQAVNVWFTPDGGLTHELLAWQIGADGGYRWTVPNTITREGMIAVETTDLVDATAVDYSDGYFHITTLPLEAVSPVTGEEEPVYAVVPGDIIGAPGFPEDGYYVDTNMQRRTALTKEIALTYVMGDETPAVSEVSDATLSVLPVAPALVPKPGTVLVKFEDSSAVYATEGVPEVAFLRLLPSEVIAELNYGEEWKEYVMELPATLRNSYRRGSDVVTDIAPDWSILLKPADLTVLLEQYSEETM